MALLPELLDEIAGLTKVPSALDLAGIESLDSAGALVLLQLLDPKLAPINFSVDSFAKSINFSVDSFAKSNKITGEQNTLPGKTIASVTGNSTSNAANSLAKFKNVKPAQQILLKLVAENVVPEVVEKPVHKGLRAWVTNIGKTVELMWTQGLALVAFFGVVFQCFWAIMLGKRKLRVTSVVHHIERTGLDAVPIICLLCFIFGSVVAYLSATAMKDFGAGILTVDIVSVSFLREFGVLLTAILVAGRSGSAFTAEIGSMRTREEVDAIKSLSLDPVELLVIPRICALVITLPVLSFLAVLAGILGGAVVGATSLDITVNMFLTRMQDNTELYYLWLGLLKAPVFAFVIASIGCLEGLKVSGSAESVGLHTTSSVVQSIFLVIVIDAMFAVLFMQLDL
jgi:phospholipid/cholesterol/gamma-HCH transport system permease protein